MSSEKSTSLTKKVFGAIGIALTVALIAFNANSIFGTLSTIASIGSSGVVSSANLAVYSDSQCTSALTSINWGSLSPGGNTSVTVYVKNTGNVALILSFSTSNWSPLNATRYLTLTWSYTGARFNPSSVLPVVLTLSVSPSIQGIDSYQFSVNIMGTQA
jgi:hypothetical protein